MKNQKLLSQMVIMPLILLILFIGLSYGQIITGKIGGNVTDDQGEPLPGVTVEASSPSAMGIQTSITSDKGTFRFANLAVGRYKVVFILDGFQRVERENIAVKINTTVTLGITMKLQTLEEEVTVIAESPVIDVKKSGMSTNFTTVDIDNIPAGRSSFADIVKQAPGMLAQGESGALRWNS